MRARLWYFLTGVISVVALVAFFAGVGWGALVLGWALSGLCLGGFAFTNQVRLASPKIITDRLSISVGPDAGEWISLPAVPCKEGLAWEESWAIPLGGGYLGVAIIPSLREYGLLIIAKHLLLNLNGQYIGLGHTITLRPHHRALAASLNRSKPMPKDPRIILPRSWWSIFTRIDGWKEDSPIFLVQDPSKPFLPAGDPKFPKIAVPELGVVPLLELLVKSPRHRTPENPEGLVSLKTLIKPEMVVLDWRPEMAARHDQNLAAARAYSGEVETNKDKQIQGLERIVEGLVATDDRVSGSYLTQAVEFATGEEQGSERRA